MIDITRRDVLRVKSKIKNMEKVMRNPVDRSDPLTSAPADGRADKLLLALLLLL
jgi:hypothetical protein